MDTKQQSTADKQAKAHDTVESIRNLLARKRNALHSQENNKDGSIIKVGIEKYINPTSPISIHFKTNGWPSIYGYINIQSLPLEEGKGVDYLNHDGPRHTFLQIHTTVDEKKKELVIVVRNTVGNDVDLFDERDYAGTVPENAIFNSSYSVTNPENVDFLERLLDGFIADQIPRLHEEGLRKIFHATAILQLHQELSSTNQAPKRTVEKTLNL